MKPTSKVIIASLASVFFSVKMAQADCAQEQQTASLNEIIHADEGKPTYLEFETGDYIVGLPIAQEQVDTYLEIYPGKFPATAYQFAMLRAFEKVGLVNLQESPDLNGKAWDLLLGHLLSEKKLGDMVGKASVHVTAKGLELARGYGKNNDGKSVYLKLSEKHSLEIVDIQQLKSGTESYAVVKAKMKAEIPPEARDVYQAASEILGKSTSLPACLQTDLTSDSNKAIELFKLDPFACKWEVVTDDYSYSLEGAFCSDHVEQTVKALH